MFAKKNLVAAAALLALVGAAQAQSSVKLYGYLEAGVGSFKAVDGKSTTKVTSGDMMTSFIGFSGVEDLGGGLKAEFVLESFIGVDSGSNVPNQAGQYWSRGSWVGLSGGFGKVALGQYDTPLFVAGLAYNPFGSSMTFSPTMRHFYNLGSTSSKKTINTSQTDTGWVNSITYETPVYAGFSGTLQFSPKESPDKVDEETFSNSYTVGGSYNNGPLSVMAVYVDAGKSPSNGVVGGDKVFAYPTEFRATNLSASYDFGVVKAFGQYTRFKYYETKPLASTDSSVDPYLSGITKSNVWQLGVSAPVSASGTVMASYGQAKFKAADGSAKSKILSLGYDHALSKRTSAYTAFTSEKLTGLESGRALAVGVKHTF